ARVILMDEQAELGGSLLASRTELVDGKPALEWVAEAAAMLAAAKEAGLQPIMEWGSAKSGRGLAFPLQNLMAASGPVEPINDWIFQKPGATIDTPSNLEAAQHLER
ncbi:hypothetical protein, partial [Klebsiella pneumoniae]|uniref:hypothetical protein n=1 Tax=Klebsiella pneumoniae TaxID=573 RepID=UPI003A8096DB